MAEREEATTPDAAPASATPPPARRSAKRRRWRSIFRRLRFYAPVCVLILLGMAVYLPLSPEWLRSRVEAEARAATGLPVHIERVRIRIITGDIEVQGIEVRHPGAEPFRVGRVQVLGDLAELIDNSGNWPAEIVVHDVPPVRVVVDDQGARLEGAWQALVDAIGEARPPAPDRPAPAFDRDPPADPRADLPARGTGRPTPALSVRNVEARIDAPSLFAGTITASVPNLLVSERQGASDAYAASIDGVVVARGAEEFSASVKWFPRDERLAVIGRLSGLAIDFDALAAGALRYEMQDARIEAVAARESGGAIAANARIALGESTLRQTGLGGQAWMERELDLRVAGRYQDQRLDGIDLRLLGDEVDIRVQGATATTPPFESDARLRIAKLPGAALEVLQREAEGEGVRIERLADALLALEVDASGPLADPMAMRVDGLARMARWRVRPPQWPADIEVRDLRARLSGESIAIERLSAAYKGVVFDASGSVPGLLPVGASSDLRLDIRLRGPIEPLVDLGRAYGFESRDFLGPRFDGALEARVAIPLARTDEGWVPESLPPRGDWSLLLEWADGSVGVRGLPEERVEVSAGRLAADPAGARLDRTSLRNAGLEASVSASLAAGDGGWEDGMLGTVDAEFAGRIEGLRALLAPVATLPDEVQGLAGGIRARLRGNADLPRFDAPLQGWLALEPEYDLRLDLDGVSGVLPVDAGELDFASATGRIEASNDALRIVQLAVRPTVGGAITVDALIDGGTAEASFRGEAPIELARQVAPRDLNELVTDGAARVDGRIWFEIAEPLPDGPDAVRRWVAALAGPDARRIGVLEGDPIRLRIDADLEPIGEATFFHRDLPHRIHSLTGSVRANQTGFQIRNLRGRWGEDDGPNGEIRMPRLDIVLGHLGPVDISFDLESEDLDINAWFDGWGTRPWAERPPLPPRRWAPPRPPRDPDAPAPPSPPPALLASIRAEAELDRAQFLSLDTSDAVVSFAYEAWARQPSKLSVPNAYARVYGGSANAQAELLFPPGELVDLVVSASATDVSLRGYLEDLLEREVQAEGRFSGEGNLRAKLGDYSTWTGGGTYIVRESDFIGGQAFRFLARTFDFATFSPSDPTTLRGRAIIRDEIVRLPDFIAENREIKMVADGHVGFYADLDFLVTVEILGRAGENIFVLGRVNRLIQSMANRLFTVTVRGTITEPVVETRPTILDPFGIFGRNGERRGEPAGEPGERGALGRPL